MPKTPTRAEVEKEKYDRIMQERKNPTPKCECGSAFHNRRCPIHGHYISTFNIPKEVLDAAETVKNYMEKAGEQYWQLSGVCDRRFATDPLNAP